MTRMKATLEMIMIQRTWIKNKDLMSSDEQIQTLKKLILDYSRKLDMKEFADEESQEDLLDAIDQCFSQIAQIELSLASKSKKYSH